MNTENITDVVNTQKPIQVRKISQLDTLSISYNSTTEHYEGTYVNENGSTYTLDLANAYVIVGYPSNDMNYPHNYKLSINKFVDYGYFTSKAINNLYNYINNKFDILLTYFSYVTSYFVGQPIANEIVSNIEYYWNGIDTPTTIIDTNKYWNQNIDR